MRRPVLLALSLAAAACGTGDDNSSPVPAIDAGAADTAVALPDATPVPTTLPKFSPAPSPTYDPACSPCCLRYPVTCSDLSTACTLDRGTPPAPGHLQILLNGSIVALVEAGVFTLMDGGVEGGVNCPLPADALQDAGGASAPADDGSEADDGNDAGEEDDADAGTDAAAVGDGGAPDASDSGNAIADATLDGAPDATPNATLDGAPDATLDGAPDATVNAADTSTTSDDLDAGGENDDGEAEAASIDAEAGPPPVDAGYIGLSALTITSPPFHGICFAPPGDGGPRWCETLTSANQRFFEARVDPATELSEAYALEDPGYSAATDTTPAAAPYNDVTVLVASNRLGAGSRYQLCYLLADAGATVAPASGCSADLGGYCCLPAKSVGTVDAGVYEIYFHSFPDLSSEGP